MAVLRCRLCGEEVTESVEEFMRHLRDKHWAEFVERTEREFFERVEPKPTPPRPRTTLERIRELERAGAIVPATEEEERRAMEVIDPLWQFAEVPSLWLSRKPGYPDVLLYQGRVWRVLDARAVIEGLSLVAFPQR
jgi:hypothetical protein